MMSLNSAGVTKQTVIVMLSWITSKVQGIFTPATNKAIILLL